jgi:branched-subunit amino acid ABC-type transport system permease component
VPPTTPPSPANAAPSANTAIATYSVILTLLLMVGVLAVRPQGLLGRKL